jgi:methionine biosynthesis protein MetW
MTFIDDPTKNDNRQYHYDENLYLRKEFPIISGWIEEGTKVIDLGCGNGALMKYLVENNKVNIEGIELSASGVEVCQKNGLRAKVGEIDKRETYNNYSDEQFDYAICNVTLQMVMYPEVLIKEMKRIAKKIIISFPNFGYIGNRFDLLIHGRMPLPMLYGYYWYNTGHIHQLSIKDFMDLCKLEHLTVIKSDHLGFLRILATRVSANVFSKIGVFLCEKN